MVMDTGTALFAETAALIVSGAAGVMYLASLIQNLVCRERKTGIVIDARPDPLSITEVPNLPGGTVITITAEGKQQTHDACAGGFDLASLIAALRSLD